MSSQQLSQTPARRNLTAAVFPPLLLGLNWLIFGTWGFYSLNPEDLLITYSSVVWTVFAPALLAFVGLGLLSTRLNNSHRLVFNTLLMFLALATYIHGNWLSWDTGVLDGNQLDFTQKWRSGVDTLVWLMLAYVTIRFRKWLLLHGWQLCLVLIIFQTIGLADSLLQFKPQTRSVTTTFPDKMETFSANSNVIQIVLDGFQGNVFEQLTEQHPELTKALNGFTFFRDASTSSAVTYLSIPAILSGIEFNNQTSISDYHKTTLEGDNIYRLLAENNFAVDIATPMPWVKPEPWFTNYFRIPTPYANGQQIRTSTIFLLLDLSLFRQVPHFLKSSVYNSGSWLLSGTLVAQPQQQFQSFSHLAFLTEMRSRIAVTSDQPRYKFMHIVTPHAPLVTEADCSFSGTPREYSTPAYSDQAFCTFKQVAAFLNELKTKGIYDNSLILIHGDHGGGVPFPMTQKDGESTDSFEALDDAWGNPLPLVLIKPIGAQGAMRTSNKLVQLSDIAKTIGDALELQNNLPGNSMLDASNNGDDERVFYHSSMHRNDAWIKDRFDDFSSYQISGSIFDEESWELESYYAAPVINELRTYNWSTKLTFGSDGNYAPFRTGDWALAGSPKTTWSVGSKVSLAFNFGTVENTVKMRAIVKPLLAVGKLDKQQVNIYVDDSKVGEWLLTNNRFTEVELNLPAHLFNTGGKTTIAFEFPDSASPEALGTGRDNRQLAVAFNALQFDLISEDKKKTND